MKFKNNSNAQIDDSKEVPLITFPVLSKIPFLKHGFSTRLGGVSEGFFSTMNFGVDTSPYQDKPEYIMENYIRIAKRIGVDPHSFVISRQVHKTNIRVVDDSDCGKGLYLPTDYEEIDGLITNKPGITLVTKYADCVPLYFVDPVKKVIGLSHSGWRGTVKKIGKITVEAMTKHFLCDPSDIIAVIGPSICGECYEIGAEVAAEFEAAFEAKQAQEILKVNDNGKYQCDLWLANQAVILEAGILPEHIHFSGVCTCCNSDLLFSHRRAGAKRGSLAAFLAMK